MPSGSRFTHETTQHRVIALCMFLLLILSLALVWAVSGERRATLAGMSLALPPGWSQAPAPAAGEGVRVVERYIMGEEPQTLNLLLARLDESQAEDLQKASQSVLRQWARRWDLVLQQQRIQREVEGVSVEELRLMGFNRDFIGRRDQLHMLSVINADGRLWMIYLEITQPLQGIFAPTVIPSGAREMFDRMLDSLRIETDAQPL